MICPMVNLYKESFSEYDEPNTWRESWKPIKEQYHSNLTNPIRFEGKEEPFDFYKLRDEIVKEDLELTKIIAPIRFKDNETYYKEEPVVMQSLFTIKN